MAKSKELRDLSDDQLVFALQETQDKLFKSRFQAASEKLDSPSTVRKLKREIARIKTIQNERLLARGPVAVEA